MFQFLSSSMQLSRWMVGMLAVVLGVSMHAQSMGSGRTVSAHLGFWAFYQYKIEGTVLPTDDVPYGILANTSELNSVGTYEFNRMISLEAGKSYTFTLTNRSTNYGDEMGSFSCVAPPGCFTEINGERRNAIKLYAPINLGVQIVTVRVVRSADEFVGRIGTASALSAGRIFWQVSLGDAEHGHPLPALALVDSGLSDSWDRACTPAALVLEDDGWYSWAARTNGAISFCEVTQGCVMVDVLSATSFRLRFYPGDSDRGSDKAPFVTYTISRGTTATSLRIVKETRNLPNLNALLADVAVARTEETTLVRDGGTWTATGWHTGTTALTQETCTESALGGTPRTETATVRVPGGAVASQVERTVEAKPWGEEVVQQTVGSGTNQVATAFDYYTTGALSAPSNDGKYYGWPSSVSSSGGSWEAFDYTPEGMVWKRHRPFGNTSLPAQSSLPASTAGEVAATNYAGHMHPSGLPEPTEVITKIDNTTIARATFSYVDTSEYDASNTRIALQTQITRTDYTGSGATLVTVSKERRPDDGPITPMFVQTPDGVKRSHIQPQFVSVSGSGVATRTFVGTAPYTHIRKIVVTGTTTSTGNTSCTSVEGQTIDEVYLVTCKSTYEASVYDFYGKLFRTEMRVWNGSIWVLIDATEYTYNLVGQLTSRVSLNGATYTAMYDGELKMSETDETGITTTYTRDAAGRISTATRNAYGNIGALTTTYQYDAMNRVTGETRQGGAAGGLSSESLVTTNSYDSTGNLTSVVTPDTGTTSYSYVPGSRTRTTTRGTSTVTETYLADGAIYSRTGTGTVPEYYTYTVESDGRRCLRVNLGTSTSPRWRKTWTDWKGRTVETARPGYNGASEYTETMTYNAKGQLRKVARGGGRAATLYAYDDLGQLSESGLDLNGNEVLDGNATDRIQNTSRLYTNAKPGSTDWWLKTTTSAFATDNDSDSLFTVNTTYDRVTGFTGNLRAETESVDAEGRKTGRRTEVNPSTATTTITVSGDGIANSVTTTVAGLVTSEQTSDGLIFSTGYDALLRVSSRTNPRTGDSTLQYVSGTSLPWKVFDAVPNRVVLYGYDSLGRRNAETDANNVISRTVYNNRGQVFRRWGSGTAPVEYTYDTTYGDRTGVTTYRTTTPSLWSGSEWPTSPPTGDLSQSVFDPGTGLLSSRTEAGQITSYKYNACGQTTERSWTRSLGESSVALTVTYGYSDATGELSTATYSDGTHGVGYTYTRLGQVETVTDATGTHTLAYTPGKPWRLNTETLDATYYGGRVLTELYEETGWVGRDRGFRLKMGEQLEHEQTQAWTNGGRIDTLTAHGATFTYTYEPSSGLVKSFTTGGSNAFTVSAEYDPKRDLLTHVEHRWNNASSVATHDYEYNALQQREKAVQSGAAFSDLGTISQQLTYNNYGQLENAIGAMGSDPTVNGQQLPGRRHEYTYDDGGHRRSVNHTGVAGLVEDITLNARGQPLSRENHTLAVAGTAVAEASVNVEGSSGNAGRKGRFWSDDLIVGNANSPWRGNVSVTSTLPVSGQSSVVRTETRMGQVPPALQNFTYYSDGNLQSDGIWDYSWDAENRLIAQETASAAAGAGYVRRRLEFKYDYAHRRVSKRVYGWAGGWSLTEEHRYVYHGSTLVLELKGTSTFTALRAYTWGLGLGGGLRQIVDVGSSITYYPCHDGQGNVTVLVNGGTGQVAAAYEYRPLGEPLRVQTFVAALADQPFRFGMGMTDVESGFICGGTTWYDPARAAALGVGPDLPNVAGLGENPVVTATFARDFVCGASVVRHLGDQVSSRRIQRRAPVVFATGSSEEDVDWQDQGWEDDTLWSWDPFFFEDMEIEMEAETAGTADSGASDGGGLFGLLRDLVGGVNHVLTKVFGGVSNDWAGAPVMMEPVPATLETNNSVHDVPYYLRRNRDVAPNSVASVGGNGTTTGSSRNLTPEREAELRKRYGKYLNPMHPYDSPGEAYVSGALRAATRGGAVHGNLADWKDSYKKHEYLWGVVRLENGKYISTIPTTDLMNNRAIIDNNRWIVQSSNEGTLVLIGHDHPAGGGMMPYELSGYGRGGVFDVIGGDKGVAARFGVPIIAIDPWGDSHAGDRYQDHITVPGIDLSGQDFLDVVTLIRNGR